MSSFAKIFLFTLLLNTPQYLAAQSSQKDIATMKQLLDSAIVQKMLDSTEASRLVREGLVLAQKNNDVHWISQCYSALAIIQEANGRHEKAQIYYFEEYKLIDKLADTVKFQIFSDLGFNYRKLGKFQEAKYYVGKEYELAIKLDKPKLILISYVDLGVLYSTFNDLSNASDYLIKATDLGEKIRDFDQASDSYRALAFLYVKTKNFDAAYVNSEKSLVCAAKVKEASFPFHRLQVSNVFILKETGHYDQAIERAAKAIARCKVVNDKPHLAKVYYILADCYFKINDLGQSEFYFQQSKALISSMESDELKTYYLSYGALKLKKNEFNEALAMFKISLNYSEKDKSTFWMLKNYNILSEAYEKMGKVDSSLSCLKKANVLKDSLYAETNAKGVIEAQFKFDLSKNEAQLKELKLRNTSIIAFGIVAFFMFALGFLVYFLYSNEIKNRILLENNKAIADKNRQLEDANEMMRQFAFASAHDLKEPLRNINSFVNIIQRKYMKQMPPEASEYMGFVTHGVARMEKLLNALLEFSSLFDKDNIADKENDISRVLTGVFDDYQDQILDKKAVIQYPSVFPKIRIKEAYLKQLLSNLVSNALKFTKNEPKIEVGCRKTGSEFVIFVKDNGIGLNESYSDKIFQLFRRLDVTAQHEGAGIGLTICKNIVDKYNGKIWFESKLGEGTTFFIAFPETMISELPTEKMRPILWKNDVVEKEKYKI